MNKLKDLMYEKVEGRNVAQGGEAFLVSEVTLSCGAGWRAYPEGEAPPRGKKLKDPLKKVKDLMCPDESVLMCPNVAGLDEEVEGSNVRRRPICPGTNEEVQGPSVRSSYRT